MHGDRPCVTHIKQRSFAMKYDIAVFIGRFQPFHLGHLEVVLTALENAKYLTILVGSATSPRSHRNPWTFEERMRLVHDSIPGHLRNRVKIKPLEDAAYNDSRWIYNVQSSVERSAWEFGFLNMPNVALIGHSKDQSSYYLKLFPQWESIEVSNHKGLDSTRIRGFYFFTPEIEQVVDYTDMVPAPVVTWLTEFKKTKDYSYILNEYDHIRTYKKAWEAAPYPPVFVTVDAVVVQSGHVLLVRRRAAPGKGLWAMPGGFINQQERIEDAVIRELREETGIKVPDPVLRGSIVARDVFDDPNRSARGRTITHAFLFKLKDDTSLPRVKGMDDADKARWIPIIDLKRENFFEDHIDIINNLIGRI